MAASVLEVLITGDASSLKAAYGQAQAATVEFNAAQKEASAVTQRTAASSKGLTQAMTFARLGLIAFAALSVKSAIAFNREFTLIAAVTNTASKRIEGLKQTVMDMSHTFAIAPTEIAHSLYFLASAGLSTSQQMDALKASTEGAAIGLGDAGDLARITANALNAFHDQGLQASSVMDTLTAAVREGTAEPDAFAQALGRVLPIADNAGISFQQVAASLATMSNAGLDVNEGVTALRAMLQSLVAPTAQTQEAFQAMGLSVDQVVNSISQKGLISTLRMVSAAAKENTQSTGDYNVMMRHAIPNIRGLAGALNLTQQQAKKVDEIFKQVANSTGDADKAFKTTAESDAFKLQQSLIDLRNAGQELATDVLPKLASGLGLVADHAKGLLQILIGYGAIKFATFLVNQYKAITAAAVEARVAQLAAQQVSQEAVPTTFLMGKPVQNMEAYAASTSKAAKASGLFSRGLTAVKANIGAASIVAASAIATFTVLKGVWDDAHINLQQMAKDTKLSADMLGFWRDKMDLSGSAFENHSFEGFITSLNGIGGNLTELTDKLQPVTQQLDAMGLSGKDLNQVISQLQPPIDGTSGSIDRFVGEVEGARDTITGAVKDFRSGNLTWDEFKLNMNAIGISTKGAMEIANGAVDKFGQSVTKTGQIVRNFMGMTDKEFSDWSSSVQDTFAAVQNKSDIMQGNLAKDLHKMAEAAKLMNHDMSQLKDADWIPAGFLQFLAEKGPSAVHDFVTSNTAGQHQMVADWKTYQKNFNDTMDALTRAIKKLTNAINGVPKAHDTKFSSNADAEKVKVNNFHASLKALPTHMLIDIKTHVHGSDLPDEVLRKHLFAPMKQAGFKRVGDAYTLPLDIGAHTDIPSTYPGGNATPGADKTRRDRQVAGLGDLKKIEQRQLQVLFDIRREIKKGGVGGGGGPHGSLSSTGGSSTGGSSSGGGGTGTGTPIPHDLQRQLKDFGIYVKSVQGSMYGNRWVKEMTKALKTPGIGQNEVLLLKQAMRDMAKVTNPKEAHKAADEWRKAARRFSGDLQDDLHKQNEEERKAWMADALAYATHNVPRLPRGHTNISVNHHERHRKREVTLDRKRFTDSAGYEVDYGRGF